MRLFASLLVLASLLLPYVAMADLATSTSFKIKRGLIDVGSGHATSTSYEAEGSVGQPATGISTSTSFILKGGFLYFSTTSQATSAPPAAPPAPPPSVTIPGAGGFILPPSALPPELIPPLSPEAISLCDFNGDGRCNLIDLSIMLFYYDKFGPQIVRYDFNRSSRVDFPDVSILMFYWTG